MTPLQIDQRITIDIEKLTYSGEALARYEGYTVLAPRGVPGDRVAVRVVSLKGNEARAEIEEVLTPSPWRVHPECRAFHDGCGGCQWLQIAYDTQLDWKKRIVEDICRQYDMLSHIHVHEVVGMAHPFFYRNKIVVRVRGKQDALRVGFHTPRTKWVIDVFNREGGKCYIQQPLNNHLGAGLAASLTRKRLPLKSATMRSSDEDEVSLDLDRRLSASISADLEGIGRQSPYVHYTIHGRRFRVTSPSFFQANTKQTTALVDAVCAMLPDTRLTTLIDVYCGVGLFSLCLAERADRVVGIEESYTAIEDARYNAGMQAQTNVRFVLGKAEHLLPEITAETDRVDAVLLDPPRSGCHPDVLAMISRCRPERLVYVSCNVTTLTRDLAVLHGHGYTATDIQPVDMFPHTYHIECVAKCVRR